MKQLSLPEFLSLSKDELIVDVRTPLEFEQGHIINAINIPLFTNEERVLVGTCYKQQGRQAAILLGFELIGGRWAEYIKKVLRQDFDGSSTGSDEPLSLASQHISANKKVFIHCWRGGMRSAAMAWALSMYGFDVFVLIGGYKKCRQFYLETLEKKYPIIVLSGKTGCAKTATLHEMKILGEQIVDLEALAHHQGSSFGSKGSKYQPSQEQFENRLAHDLIQLNGQKRIWFENESIVIGKRVIPPIIFDQLRKAQIVDILIPIEERIDFLAREYGILEKEFLKESVMKISKRLGPNETKITLQAIDENRMKDFIKQVLVYYDKTYQRGQEKRERMTIHAIELSEINPRENARAVIALANEKFVH